MSQEYIEIRGARENNLKDVSLRIPKRKITIFTGVSGSGKSSIVFDTIASELHKKGSIYVMDEPTTGLHMSDIGHLLAVINRLVDTGNTVIAIEHNMDVIKNADWIIDMGPEGGHKGGTVMFEGTPKQLLRAERSLTGTYLRRHYA